MSNDEIALIRRATQNYLETRPSPQPKQSDAADGLRSLDLCPIITAQYVQFRESSSLADDWKSVSRDLWVAINSSLKHRSIEELLA